MPCIKPGFALEKACSSSQGYHFSNEDPAAPNSRHRLHGMASEKASIYLFVRQRFRTFQVSVEAAGTEDRPETAATDGDFEFDNLNSDTAESPSAVEESLDRILGFVSKESSRKYYASLKSSCFLASPPVETDHISSVDSQEPPQRENPFRRQQQEEPSPPPRQLRHEADEGHYPWLPRAPWESLD